MQEYNMEDMDQTRATEAELELKEQDEINAARSFYDTREFSRAAHVLEDCKSPRAIFLAVYCQFLVRQVLL